MGKRINIQRGVTKMDNNGYMFYVRDGDMIREAIFVKKIESIDMHQFYRSKYNEEYGILGNRIGKLQDEIYIISRTVKSKKDKAIGRRSKIIVQGRVDACITLGRFDDREHITLDTNKILGGLPILNGTIKNILDDIPSEYKILIINPGKWEQKDILESVEAFVRMREEYYRGLGPKITITCTCGFEMDVSSDQQYFRLSASLDETPGFGIVCKRCRKTLVVIRSE